jgi:hypothetical protein
MIELLRESDPERRSDGGLVGLSAESDAILELGERGLLLSDPCNIVIWAGLGDSDSDIEPRFLMGARRKGEPLMFMSTGCNPDRGIGIPLPTVLDSSSAPGDDRLVCFAAFDLLWNEALCLLRRDISLSFPPRCSSS